MAVIPWTNADHFTYNENFQGEFDVTLDIPAGGPYRIDTGLETKKYYPGSDMGLPGGLCASHRSWKSVYYCRPVKFSWI